MANGKTISVKGELPTKLHRELRILMIEEGMTVQAGVTQAVVEYLQRKKADRPAEQGQQAR